MTRGLINLIKKAYHHNKASFADCADVISSISNKLVWKETKKKVNEISFSGWMLDVDKICVNKTTGEEYNLNQVRTHLDNRFLDSENEEITLYQDSEVKRNTTDSIGTSDISKISSEKSVRMSGMSSISKTSRKRTRLSTRNLG